MLKKIINRTSLKAVFVFSMVSTVISGYTVEPVSFKQVHVDGGFWLPRLETNYKVTIPYDFRKSEQTGRIDNFSKAAGLMKGEHLGPTFNDSDVFKIIEGAAYSLMLTPNPELESYLDELICKIAAAQEEDGYLFTARTINPEKCQESASKVRWGNIRFGHELYNMGHLYEAAVAYYEATGKRDLLDVALKSADLIESVFGPNKKRDVPGHQEIEIGLVKLFRITGNEKYLKLAKFFLDERGHANDRVLYQAYAQDHKPVVEQCEAVGHAVRAVYMYAGMADVANLTGDTDYIKAIDAIWENVVSKKLYLTGGIGARHEGEAFGDNYELPNATAYNETCAAIANIMWNHRLFLLHEDAKYIDVLERTLYNGFLSGVSLTGDSFFYSNPLEADGKFGFNQGANTRKEWFGCSCCPTNVARFIPSFPGYAYAVKDNDIYLNLYVSSTGTLDISGNKISIKQKTVYPWSGTIQITIDPEKKAELTLKLRIPGWARGQVVPSDLYCYGDGKDLPVTIKVNGKKKDYKIEKGYAAINRKWSAGDVIELELPMPVRRVISNSNVTANQDRVAIERGPIVYCLEGIDNNGRVSNLFLPDISTLSEEFKPELLDGVVVVFGDATTVKQIGLTGETRQTAHKFTAVPYYAWNHRGVGEMAVWIARNESCVKRQQKDL